MKIEFITHYVLKCLKVARSLINITHNVGGMVSCRLRGTSVSTDKKLQAGGNA